jgi:hypothetical protein
MRLRPHASSRQQSLDFEPWNNGSQAGLKTTFRRDPDQNWRHLRTSRDFGEFDAWGFSALQHPK